jgi:hypothetical protein
VRLRLRAGSSRSSERGAQQTTQAARDRKREANGITPSTVNPLDGIKGRPQPPPQSKDIRRVAKRKNHKIQARPETGWAGPRLGSAP